MPELDNKTDREIIPFVILKLPDKFKNHNIKFFHDRELQFGGTFSDWRSIRAFEDWKLFRDREFKKRGISMDLFVPEAIVPCKSLEEACSLVKELMGEASQEDENLNHLKGPLREYLKDKIVPSTGKPFGEIYNGLIFKKTFYTESLNSRTYLKEFYLDFDEDKGLHFNVTIKKDNESKHSRNSLKLAFSFPPKSMPCSSSCKSFMEIYSTLLWNMNYLLFDSDYLCSGIIGKEITLTDRSGQAYLEQIRNGYAGFIQKIQEKANRKDNQ